VCIALLFVNQLLRQRQKAGRTMATKKVQKLKIIGGGDYFRRVMMRQSSDDDERAVSPTTTIAGCPG